MNNSGPRILTFSICLVEELLEQSHESRDSAIDDARNNDDRCSIHTSC